MTNARGNVAEMDLDELEEGRVSTTFSTPIAMKIEIERLAHAKGQLPNEFVRNLVADAIGYLLPAMKTRSSKFSSEEEKIAAAKAKQAEHRLRMQALLDRHRKEAGLPVSRANSE